MNVGGENYLKWLRSFCGGWYLRLNIHMNPQVEYLERYPLPLCRPHPEWYLTSSEEFRESFCGGMIIMMCFRITDGE